MKEKFIDKSIRIYMNKYDYSLVEYVDSKTKVKIICPIHGIFEKTPANHIRNKNRQGCQKCSVKIRSEIIKKPINDFIKNSIEIHGDKYDYSLVEYENNKTPENDKKVKDARSNFKALEVEKNKIWGINK